MKSYTVFAFIIVLAISACAPSMDEPVNNETPSATETATPFAIDSNLSRGGVFLDSVELLVMESYPPQFTLALKGNLPTPCHQLRVEVSPPDSDNKVMVEVFSVVNPDVICIQTLKPFELNHPLGSFPSGAYSLWVNGAFVTEFDA
jgi:hypothetical protein